MNADEIREALRRVSPGTLSNMTGGWDEQLDADLRLLYRAAGEYADLLEHLTAEETNDE